MNTIYTALTVIFLALSANLAASDFAAYEQPIPGSELSIFMVPIKGGSFSMGSPEDESGRSAAEGPQHDVAVADFWMGQFEINWQQYELFIHRNEYFAQLASSDKLQALGIDGVTGATAPYMEMSMGMGKEGFPAVNMTQYAALRYARWLSAKTGQFYRLPTEAEWEYACRAGTTSAWSFSASPHQLDDFAVTKENSGGAYAATGSRTANAWQLYDMHGNVAEWTMDQFDPEFYSNSDSNNPWLRPKTLYPRSTRGGSWAHPASASRCAARMASSPDWKGFDPQIPRSLWWHTSAPFVGFRLVRPRVQPDADSIKAYWPEAIDDYGQ